MPSGSTSQPPAAAARPTIPSLRAWSTDAAENRPHGCRGRRAPVRRRMAAVREIQVGRRFRHHGNGVRTCAANAPYVNGFDVRSGYLALRAGPRPRACVQGEGSFGRGRAPLRTQHRSAIMGRRLGIREREAMADRHVFTAKLVLDASRMTYVDVPAAVSRALGRGKAPVEARIGRGEPFRGTFMPAGGGRHRLFVSKAAREAAGAKPGDRVRIAAVVDRGPREVPIPPDLHEALVDAGVLGAWEGMPPGKREHILNWVDSAVHETTRETRIRRSVEEALRAHEKNVDRAMRRVRRRSDGAARSQRG